MFEKITSFLRSKYSHTLTNEIIVKYIIDFNSEIDCYDSNIKFDTNINDVDYYFSQIHDEDYNVFCHFKYKNKTFIDIGTNYGYSATSLWYACINCSALSFEPIP